MAFSAVSSAVRAALEMREVIHAYNRSLEVRRQHCLKADVAVFVSEAKGSCAKSSRGGSSTLLHPAVLSSVQHILLSPRR